ncbi:MAG: O-antigen ligase family protein [Deltaproteobacteria bacterium]|nr:O-antigen ligase family protein [Deltaproteobacteria bacterium]
MTRTEKIAWLAFGAASLQLAFLQPYIILVPGERTNLFSGALCLLSLIVALIFAGRGAIRFRSPEFLVSVVLVALAVTSALSDLPLRSPSFRVAVLLASGLGGFWCARLLLHTPENQRRFQWLCLMILGGVLLLSLTGYLLRREIHYFFFKGSNHPLTNLIFLLSFAPLTLLREKSRPLVLLGVALLSLSYVVLCLSERLSVVFIPVGLGVVGLLFGTLRWKHVVAALLILGLIIGVFSQQILWFKLSTKYPTYRIENYFFSWAIARQHPLLGIGLSSNRDQFLKDYQIKYPYETKEQFSKDVAYIVTPDNQLLTFLSGLGFPFTIIYFLAVLALLVKLVAMTFRPPPGLYFHPLALLFPLAAALLHYQLYDGLLFPQNSWFFHILLGLISLAPAPRRVEPAHEVSLINS